MDREGKLKALENAVSQIEKTYGKGSVMKLGDSNGNMNIETIPTMASKPMTFAAAAPAWATVSGMSFGP